VLGYEPPPAVDPLVEALQPVGMYYYQRGLTEFDAWRECISLDPDMDELGLQMEDIDPYLPKLWQLITGEVIAPLPVREEPPAIDPMVEMLLPAGKYYWNLGATDYDMWAEVMQADQPDLAAAMAPYLPSVWEVITKEAIAPAPGEAQTGGTPIPATVLVRGGLPRQQESLRLFNQGIPREPRVDPMVRDLAAVGAYYYQQGATDYETWHEYFMLDHRIRDIRDEIQPYLPEVWQLTSGQAPPENGSTTMSKGSV
jgi:hypothetical protein